MEPLKASESPYFATLPLLGLPKISAPRVLQRRDAESNAADAGAEHDGDPRWRRRKYMILYADLLSSNVNWRCYKKETKKFEQKEPFRESTKLISIESKVDVEGQREH